MYAQAFGQEVTIISTSPKKEKEAREILKADHFVVSRDEKQMSVRAYPLLVQCPYSVYRHCALNLHV